jgi:exopolysaccharide production protein ExoQ
VTEAVKEYPRIPDRLALAYVAATMLIMAYSPHLKVLPILAFLIMWLSHVYYKKTFVLRPSWDFIAVMTFPFLCAYSTLWSDYPRATFYAGAGLCMMVACTVVIARTVATKPFLKGVSLGTCLVMLAALLFSPNHDFIELFGSKNEVGFYAELGVYTSVLILFSSLTWREKLVYAVIPLGISGTCLILSSSASSVVSLFGALGIVLGMYLLTRVSRPFRLYVLGAALFAIATAAILAVALDINPLTPVLNSFGKDSTLTGRTYLWGEGIKNGLKRPILGYGYFGFWQPGRPEAEQYWHEFGIDSRTGFHFHNLLIQTFVDFGFTGLTFILLLILSSCFMSARAGIKDGMNMEVGYALGMSFLFLVRAFVEVDIFGPFGIGPFLYFSIIPRLARNTGQ